MVTKIGRYPGIVGNREDTAGFGLFSDIGQYRSENLSHIIYINGTVRRPSEDRLVTVRLFPKRNILGASEAVNTDRTSNTNRRLSYDVRAITGPFTGHRMNIARVSYGQRTMLVPGPAECVLSLV